MQYVEKHSTVPSKCTTAGTQGPALSERARSVTDWRRERRQEMAELKDRQQQEAQGKLQCPSCLMLMARVLVLAGFDSIYPLEKRTQ